MNTTHAQVTDTGRRWQATHEVVVTVRVECEEHDIATVAEALTTAAQVATDGWGENVARVHAAVDVIDRISGQPQSPTPGAASGPLA